MNDFLAFYHYHKTRGNYHVTERLNEWFNMPEEVRQRIKAQAMLELSKKRRPEPDEGILTG